LAKDTIKRVCLAEQAAEDAEKIARAEAEDIIRAAHKKADSIVQNALSDAKRTYSERIDNAKAQTEALAKSNKSEIIAQINKISSDAEQKSADVNRALIAAIL
jgi:vacuolar-type H+-ATPase subunit H